MSIPLDSLYQHIERVSEGIRQGHVLIYRFYPHGSKNIEDLDTLNDKSTYLEKILIPYMYCHDQEPLNYDLHKNYTQDFSVNKTVNSLINKYQIDLKSYYFPMMYHNIYDYALLLHSEQRSNNLKKYCNDNFISVYYWTHAIIALDWFRFAQHVTQKKQIQKTFLIYNRAWSGTREYRLKFIELLIRLGLQTDCQTTVNSIEPDLGIHYKMHKFSNPAWKPTTVLEDYFPTTSASSHVSAEFHIEDYEATDIEVVLETLFDDGRLHLTEKSLRPIACAQPFILAGTHGSLEYLRSYGFKTFDHIWDERYDLIVDPQERLHAIADLMKQIANWAPWVRERKMAEAQAVADYNKKYFFSNEFFNTINQELEDNLKVAFDQLENINTSQDWLSRRKQLLKYDDIKQLLLYSDNNRYHPIPKRLAIMQTVSTARKYYLHNLSSKKQINKDM